MKENILFYNYLIEEVVDDMVRMGFDISEDASQFRNTSEYNRWFSMFVAEDAYEDFSSSELNESVVEEHDVEDIANFELFLESVMEAIDPETGNDNPDAVEDAKEKAKANLGVPSPKAESCNGKECNEEDEEFEDEDEEESDEDDGLITVCLTSDDIDFDELESAADEEDVEFTIEDDDEDGEIAFITGAPLSVANVLKALDESIIDEMVVDEEGVSVAVLKQRRRKARIYRKKHKNAIRKARKLWKKKNKNKLNAQGVLKVQTSANKLAQKRRKKTLKRMGEGVEVPQSVVASIAEAAMLRSEAICEHIDSRFEDSSFFGSLNESESDEIKEMISESVKSILSESYEKIANDVVLSANEYLNEEVVPAIVDIFSNEYTKEIVSSLNEDVEQYLSYVAEQISEQLADKKLIVKSAKSAQLESFESELINLIESHLEIIPEREDALLSAKEKISDLTERLEEASIERKKITNRLNEAKREAYVLKNMPSDISESQKEKLIDYVNDVLCEASSNHEFMKYFDNAVKELQESAYEASASKRITEHKEVSEPSVKHEKQSGFSADIWGSVRSLG